MKFRGAVTLRSSVLLALLGVGLLPVLLILAASQALLRDTFENSGKRMLESATTLIARRVTETLAHAQAEMRGLAQISAIRCESSPFSEVAREMQVFCSMFPLFEDVSLYDEKGGLLATTTARFWESVRYTEWFERALRGEFVITPPIRLPGRQGLYICSYQYISPSAVGSGGVLTVRYSFEQLQRLVQDASIGRSGWVTLLDPRGNALAYPDAAQILKRPFGTRSATWWMNHPSGILHDAHGERILYHAAAVSALHTGSGEPWIVVGFLPYSEILAPLHKSRTILGITTIITLLTILGAGMVLSRILMAPLTSATRIAETVSKGALSVVMPEEGPAEVRMLASTFNRMVEDLRQYREHVEAMVEQRTAKLHESQARLEERAAHLRAALESLVDGVLMVQWPEGRVLASNHPFAELFGLKDQEPLVGRTLQEVEQWIGSRMADSREDRFQWEHFKREPEAITLEEWEVSAPTKKVLSVSSTPAIGSDGTVLARLYLFRDLTEQRQLEEELRQAQKMEAVGRLAGGIAHDFNNLLTAILGNLSMAEMEPEGARTRSELVAAARQAAQRAADLVKQLLGFSRRSTLQLELCDVNKVIHDVWELVRHSMDPRITFDVRTEPQLWRVRADRTQIQQVIMNLCVNAMDAMPAGGRLTVVTSNVRVTAEQSRQWLDARPGEYVRIAVSDEGHGMSQEVQSHLFEPFFTTKEPGKGTGLGLALSYGIVRQHGGWMGYYSELNRGTTFYIFLPRRVEGETTERVQQTEPAVRGGDESILVVDDEASVRGVVVAILQRYGYRVTEAAHGEEALQILAESGAQFDLVILDLTMPKLSGRETLCRIRQLYPELPVIVSSGYAIDLNSFAREVGVRPAGIVQKPYEAKTFALAVRQALDARKAG